MAQTFKNYTASGVGVGDTTVYTVPVATTGIIIGLTLSNITASEINATAKLNTVHIVKDAPIPTGSTLDCIEGKLIAEAGDTIVVVSNTATSVDAIVSVLEQS